MRIPLVRKVFVAKYIGPVDISSLTTLTNLTSLALYGCFSLVDTSPLQNLSNLTSLALFGCNKLTDISQLQNMTNLSELILASALVSQTNVVQLKHALPGLLIRRW